MFLTKIDHYLLVYVYMFLNVNNTLELKTHFNHQSKIKVIYRCSCSLNIR